VESRAGQPQRRPLGSDLSSSQGDRQRAVRERRRVSKTAPACGRRARGQRCGRSVGQQVAQHSGRTNARAPDFGHKRPVALLAATTTTARSLSFPLFLGAAHNFDTRPLDGMDGRSAQASERAGEQRTRNSGKQLKCLGQVDGAERGWERSVDAAPPPASRMMAI
jgi:hypothetical protein